MTSLSDLDERSSTILSAEVGVAPARADVKANQPNASVIGAAVAATICLVIATIGWQIAPEGWALGIVGLPATTFLAWRMGPGVVAADGWGAVLRALGLSIATILITDAVIVIVLVGAAVVGIPGFGLGVTATDALSMLVSALVEGIFYYLIGAVVIGIPVGVVVLPAALIWTAIVRFLVHRPG